MKKHMKKVVTAACTAILLVVLSGCEKKPVLTRYSAQFLQLFDTVTSIEGYSDDEETFTGYVQEFYDELKEYHELYDIYNDYDGINNIKTINDNAGIKPVEVDKRIIDMLLFAKDMDKKTGGMFNPAMGSVLSIWHDYRTRGIENPEDAKLPPAEMLLEAAKHTDIDKVIIDEEASTVFLEDSSMSLDVGAVGKGYATEQICQKLEKDGFGNALISVGGNVRAIGRKADNTLWRVGIQNPDTGSDVKYLHRVEIEGQSLVSSGSYQRYYTVEGEQYHHIINPETLMPANTFESVSVLCRDSGIADALSTAIFNMDLETGREMIEGMEDVEVMWILSNGEEVFTSGFGDYLNDQ